MVGAGLVPLTPFFMAPMAFLSWIFFMVVLPWYFFWSVVASFMPLLTFMAFMATLVAFMADLAGFMADLAAGMAVKVLE